MTVMTQADPRHAAWPSLDVVTSEYEAKAPWSHLVLDDVFPTAMIQAASTAALALAPTLPRTETRLVHKSESCTGLGPELGSLFAAMEDDRAQTFVRTLTGIADLVPDPTHAVAGLYAGMPGDYQSLHRDFPRHPQTRAWHRLNMMLYLSDAEPSWGGELALRGYRGNDADVVVRPTMGRLVVFETHSRTLHSVRRMSHPAGTWRLALSSCWYSAEEPPFRRIGPLQAWPRRDQDPLATPRVPSLRELLRLTGPQ